MITLRDYQDDLISRLRASLRAGAKRPLVVSPTGSGKTVTFSFLAAGITSRGQRVWLICHRAELLDQIQGSLARFGIDAGRIAAGHPYQPDRLAQVCSIQTLAGRDIAEAPDWIIVDEAHHATAKSQYGRVLTAYPGARTVGFTATPQRLDGAGMSETFDDLIVGPDVRDLIDRGALSDYRLFAPAVGVDLSGVRRRAGDFARDEAEQAMDKPAVTGDAVTHYRKLCEGAPAVAFCVSVAHAAHVAEQFRAAGYTAASIDGRMQRDDRARVLADFSAGRLNVLTSCDLISEGFDVPGIVAAVLLRPTQSLALYLQQVGRALRPAEGKSHAVILDHAGNSQRHGMPCDPREWTLEGAKSRGSKRDAAECPVRQCPTCYAISKAAAKVCRECGQEFPITAREIEQREGELIEATKMQQKRDARREQGRAQTLEDLVKIGQQRGYAPGWARRMWDIRQKQRGVRT